MTGPVVLLWRGQLGRDLSAKARPQALLQAQSTGGLSCPRALLGAPCMLPARGDDDLAVSVLAVRVCPAPFPQHTCGTLCAQVLT